VPEPVKGFHESELKDDPLVERLRKQASILESGGLEIAAALVREGADRIEVLPQGSKYLAIGGRLYGLR